MRRRGILRDVAGHENTKRRSVWWLVGTVAVIAALIGGGVVLAGVLDRANDYRGPGACELYGRTAVERLVPGATVIESPLTQESVREVRSGEFGELTQEVRDSDAIGSQCLALSIDESPARPLVARVTVARADRVIAADELFESLLDAEASVGEPRREEAAPGVRAATITRSDGRGSDCVFVAGAVDGGPHAVVLAGVATAVPSCDAMHRLAEQAVADLASGG